MRFYSQTGEQGQAYQLNQVIEKADFLIFSKGLKSICHRDIIKILFWLFQSMIIGEGCSKCQNVI